MLLQTGRKRTMRNYWDNLLDDQTIEKEDLFLKVRDLYIQYLRHLYNDPKNIPDVRIHFSADRISIGDETDSYPICTVERGSNKVTYSSIGSVLDIENFENCYTWFVDRVFVVFDFREDGISPLQFITASFWQELFRQIQISGLRKLKIHYMYEMLIASGVGEFFYGFYRLDISFLQTLSALTYEGSYVDCSLIVPRYDSKPEERRTARRGMDIVFRDPPQFSAENLRQIRKLMELSDKNTALVISEQGKIRGITREKARMSECFVRMWGNLCWTITYDGTKKISYYDAKYHLHAAGASSDDLTRILRSMNGDLDAEQLQKLQEVIAEASRQTHGTILVIGSPEDTAAESERLAAARSATEIASVNLYEKRDMISCLTSIDGAVLMDTSCNCSCIGVILDGDRVVKGNISRGARYNSTVNYVTRRAQLDQFFLGIVISEDGTVDAVTSDRITRIILRRK